MLTKWILAHRVTLCLSSARQLKRRAAMTDCVRLYLRANFVAVGRLTWPVTFQSQSTKQQCYCCLARESVCVCVCCRHIEGLGRHHTYKPFLAALTSFYIAKSVVSNYIHGSQSRNVGNVS